MKELKHIDFKSNLKLAGNLIHVLKQEIKDINKVCEVVNNNVTDVVIHVTNTIEHYSQQPIFINDITNDTITRCSEEYHSKVCELLSDFFATNKDYDLDITKNIMVSVTFIVVNELDDISNLNTIYIIQGR